MKAWILEELKGLDALRLGDFPDPEPAEGEVIIAPRFAALNPADRYLAERLYPARPEFPHILGRDGVGVVVEIGDGVVDWKVGDVAVIQRGDTGVNRRGTFAEKVAVPASDLTRVPEGWTETEAAGASLVYLTAYQALTQWGDPTATEFVQEQKNQGKPAVALITGASGGVGVACVHLAAAMGLTVVALSRSEEKRAKLAEIGADVVLDPGDPAWRKSLPGLIDGRRVDVAVDNIGGDLLPEVVASLGRGGRVSLVGRLAGPVPEFNTATLFFRRNKLGGVSVGDYSRPEADAAWAAVLDLMKKSGAKPLVDQVFEFDRLLDAFERLRQGPMGKVLLRVRG